jgi:hypothetical protein
MEETSTQPLGAVRHDPAAATASSKAHPAHRTPAKRHACCSGLVQQVRDYTGSSLRHRCHQSKAHVLHLTISGINPCRVGISHVLTCHTTSPLKHTVTCSTQHNTPTHPGTPPTIAPTFFCPRSLVVTPLLDKLSGGPSGDPAVQAAARREAVAVALAASKSGLPGQLHSCVQSLLAELDVMINSLVPLPQPLPQALPDAVRHLQSFLWLALHRLPDSVTWCL